MQITSGVNESIAAGISMGTIRFVSTIPNPNNFDIGAEDITDYHNFISDCVRALDDNWNLRAVRILSELIIIGMYSRKEFGGNALERTDVINFAENLRGVINCWSHK